MKIIKGSVFHASNDFYIAHCISADVEMGAGIALDVKNKYKSMHKNLRSNKHHISHPCVLIYEEEQIINLVTKKLYWHKPTKENFRKALEMAKIECDQRHIHKIAMPKIGCGLDRLNWDWVYTQIENIFVGYEIEIYHLD
jgi:O-acetyl-ADP-ribose deacetylase (regulator of RNase III)